MSFDTQMKQVQLKLGTANFHIKVILSPTTWKLIPNAMYLQSGSRVARTSHVIVA